MQRIVLTGGPGAGKTTVLEELRRRGYEVGDDAARSIIRQRKQSGLPPRPEPAAFAQQIFDKEIEAYRAVTASPVFFERGVVDAVGGLLGAGGISPEEAETVLKEHPYDAIFIFPPWEEIYRQDEERDHTFDHAVRVHQWTFDFYQRCGYQPIEVPCDTPANRTDFVLQEFLG